MPGIDQIEIRGLTRGEIKKLRAEGVVLGAIADIENEAEQDAALDKFFAVALPDLDADNITPGQALDLYIRITEATYLSLPVPDNIEVRELIRGEIKRLRSDGVIIGAIANIKDEGERDAAMDKFFAVALPDLDADSITPGQALDLYTRIAEASYLSAQEKKTSGSPQS